MPWREFKVKRDIFTPKDLVKKHPVHFRDCTPSVGEVYFLSDFHGFRYQGIDPTKELRAPGRFVYLLHLLEVWEIADEREDRILVFYTDFSQLLELSEYFVCEMLNQPRSKEATEPDT